MHATRFVFASIGVLLLAFGHAHAQNAAPTWPATGGGPMRQGYTNLKLPRSGQVQWSIELPGAGVYNSSPVVDGARRIFTVTNDTVTSTALSVVYCLGSTGNVTWSQQISDEFEFQPVLLSSGNLLLYSVSKQLYAFTPTGELLWRRQYSASPRLGDGEVWANYSSGLNVPTRVQALPDRDGGVILVDDSPALLRVDGAGELSWTTLLFGSCAGGLMLLNGYIYVPACDGRIHVYRASDGLEQPALALGGVSPFYPTGLPGGGVLSASVGGLGERLVLLPFNGVRGFEFPFDLPLQTPLTVNARSEYAIGIGRLGTLDGKVPTTGRIVGLSNKGKFAWSRDFNAVPSGQIIGDPTGRYCFGTQDMGASGVYQLNPQQGVEWWISTAGATTVFPIDAGQLGVLVVAERADRSDVDKNKTLLFGVGG